MRYTNCSNVASSWYRRLTALLAHPNSEGLRYAGAAFITLDEDARAEFLAEVERLTTAWAAFKSSRFNEAKWCQPKLTVRVKHLAGSKTLRHATVRGFAQRKHKGCLS